MLTDAEIMVQVLAAFQEEQAEHRQAAGEILLQLERAPEHPQRAKLLDLLFREAHSLKGGARAAGQPEVEQIAHRIEEIFSALRQGTLPLTPELCDPIYAALDAIGALMGLVAAGQPTNIAPYAPLLEALARALGDPQAGADAGVAAASENLPALVAAPAPPAQPPKRPRTRQRSKTPAKNGNGAGEPPANSNGAGELSVNGNGAGEHAHAAPNYPVPDLELLDALAPVGEPQPAGSATTIRIATTSLDGLMSETGELITCSLRSNQRARELIQIAEPIERWRRVWRQARPTYVRLQERLPSIRPAVHYLDDRDHLPSTPVAQVVDRETVVLLNALKEADDLIRDLERRISMHGRQATDDSTRLTAVVERLHDQVRRARMLPLTTIFGQIRLQVRDMARAAGKQVLLNFDDGGAEADREVLEQLRHVLTHLVRNAIDHGVEAPDMRAARGKAADGRVTLRAAIGGDRLILTMADDGAGLDLEAIKRRALAGGLVGEAELARMAEPDIQELIFLPGFSTRQVVSKLSGRGVGLDIVRAHVERMRGRVLVSSSPGAGCTFTVSVPLSLSSSHGLLLRAGNACYVLPLDCVQRIIPVTPRDIQMLEGRAALMLDGRPLALVHLADLLGLAGQAVPSSGYRLALLLGSGERQVACLVDAVLGEQELVTHRLPAPLEQVRFITSAAILADGSVVPILDAVDLLNAAFGARRSVGLATEPVAPRRSPTVLVVDDSITTRTLEKNILEAAGYQVRLATDGAEALLTLNQMADDGGCDLLLSDVDMPRLNGFDLAAQVRATPRFQHLPIVLVTSLDTPADRERGIAAGADAYIIKRNFEQHALLETIAQLL